MEVKYHKNVRSLMEAEEKKRRAEIMELEDRMKSRIVTVVEDQDRALRGAEEYYAAAQRKLLGDLKVLKVRRRVGKSHITATVSKVTATHVEPEGATGPFVSGASRCVCLSGRKSSPRRRSNRRERTKICRRRSRKTNVCRRLCRKQNRSCLSSRSSWRDTTRPRPRWRCVRCTSNITVTCVQIK